MEKFNKLIQAKFLEMGKTGKLFRVALTGDEIWDMYLKAFPKEHDPKFRDPNSTEHNCNNCKNFIRRYGNIVAIDKDLNIITMFDVDCEKEFESSARVMAGKISRTKIADVFFETYEELNSLPYESCSKTQSVFQLGLAKNIKRYTKEEAEKFGVVKANETKTFNHMHVFLAKEFVSMTGHSIDSIMGMYRDAKNVFQRGMEEISADTLKLVRDLINQGSLLNGDAHLSKIEQIIPFKEQYDSIDASKRDNWCWVTSYKLPYAKFKNELIGVLCSELSQGEELNKACLSWNKRVDPANYMKASAPITKKQIEEAKKFVEENGYAESFDRRCATVDDIKASEILHINSGNGKIKEVSVFDGVKATATRHKRSEFDKLEEVTIDKFMKDILPTCTSVEAFLANSHQNNMVTLTTSTGNGTSKPIFKWDNNYSWTFNGNLAGKSEIKQAVKDAGGRVDGVLRFSMIWNDGDGKDNSDLDAWCEQPNKERIGFSQQFRKDHGNIKSSCSGQLDLDNTNPGGKMAIENIYFSNLKQMKDGVYKFWVNQYRTEGSKGFKAEIEFDGEIYVYEHNQAIRTGTNVQVAEVTLKDGVFSVKHILAESETSSKEIYGIETNQFHKVDLVCLSPNHWGNNKVGNKHYLFMLNGAKAPTSIRGFHNENLSGDLLAHRKVMEVLGSTTSVASADKQLSGLGFNATVRDELVVKLGGTHKRMVKIKF